MSKIGYVRVSTRDQNLNSQIDVLNEYGCDRIFFEKVSGRK
ncbi:recombinase family protein [Salinicoccus halodurans]|uniref:Resolvase, N terminal domain n=1 Tax=Salinicoccus halodurans TaxID=407035 RepID=A0AA94HGW9_9STAP|nr:Resolvase, N terminal domain [Salinicoccus halodurans]